MIFSKKNYLLLSFIVLLIVLFIIFLLFNKKLFDGSSVVTNSNKDVIPVSLDFSHYYYDHILLNFTNYDLDVQKSLYFCANQTNTSSCIKDLAIKLSDESMCHFLIDIRRIDSYNIYDCFTNISIKKGVWDPCYDIPMTRDRYTCLVNAANSQGHDSSFCENVNYHIINHDKFKSLCYRLFALAQNNISTCELAFWRNDEKRCYKDFAVKFNNPSYCHMIDHNIMNDCYLIVAKNLNNSLICRYINNTNMKANCYDYLANLE